MSTFVMLALFGGYSFTLTTQEFYSEETCLAAAQILMEEPAKSRRPSYVFCVEK